MKRFVFGAAVLMALGLGAGDVMAAGGGEQAASGHGGGHHEPHANFWTWSDKAPPLGWLALDFAIFLFILYRYGGKPLSNFLVQRHSSVKAAIEEAARARAEAEKKAAEYEERIRRLDLEVASLREDFRKNGEAVKERLLESGKRMSERLISDAKMTIAAEETRAREVLKREAAVLALQLAEKMVAERLKPDDHKRLRDDFVRELRS